MSIKFVQRLECAVCLFYRSPSSSLSSAAGGNMVAKDSSSSLSDSWSLSLTRSQVTDTDRSLDVLNKSYSCCRVTQSSLHCSAALAATAARIRSSIVSCTMNLCTTVALSTSHSSIHQLLNRAAYVSILPFYFYFIHFYFCLFMYLYLFLI